MDSLATERYQRLTSRIDEIVTAVKNQKKIQEITYHKNQKHKLPGIKVSSKNHKISDNLQSVDSQFLDKFSLFCDDKLIPVLKPQISATKPKHNRKRLNGENFRSIELPPFQSLLNIQTRRLLGQDAMFQRSKSTKIMSHRLDNVCSTDCKKRTRVIQRKHKIRSAIQSPLLKISQYQEGLSKTFGNKQLKGKMKHLDVIKEANTAKNQFQQISGWEM